MTDTLANETTYDPITGVQLPLHAALMRNLGVVFTEATLLDDLAADCARDGRYESLYCCAPVPIAGGTGGSAGPLAVR